MEGLEFLLEFFVGLLLICAIIGIAAYIVNALFLRGVAKDSGVGNTWMAWVPIANIFLFSNIVSRISRDDSYRLKYLGSFAAYILLPTVGAVAESGILLALTYVAMIVFLVFHFMGLYQIYKKYLPDTALLLIILSLFTPIQFGITIYLLVAKIGKINVVEDKEYIEENYQDYQ